jgi:hypothetical protein
MMRTIGRLVAIVVVAVALFGALAGPESASVETVRVVKIKAISKDEHKQACQMEGGLCGESTLPILSAASTCITPDGASVDCNWDDRVCTVTNPKRQPTGANVDRTAVESTGVDAAPEPTATPKAGRDAAPPKPGIV